jgi:DNA-binding transcriptional ArsR family regulator
MSDERDPSPAAAEPERLIPDTAVLQTLSHPLRLRLLGLLRLYGPSTSTKLAGRCGESSGLTSYHLRQLASAGLIVEAGPEDLAALQRTGGRERWWKAAHRFTHIPTPTSEDEATEAASMDFLRAVLVAVTGHAQEWLSVAHTWPRPWQEVTNFSDYPLRLTRAEVDDLDREMTALLSRYRVHDPGQQPSGSAGSEDEVIVQMQYQIFPHPDQDPPADEPSSS